MRARALAEVEPEFVSTSPATETTLAVMAIFLGLEFCAIVFVIMRRVMPVEACQLVLAVRSRFLVVAWLTVYLIAEFSPLHVQSMCLVFLTFGGALTPVLLSRFERSDEYDVPRHGIPFLAPLASRAPPLV